jgi:hypothetical protein
MSTKPVRTRRKNVRLQDYDLGGGVSLTPPQRVPLQQSPGTVSVQHGHLAAGGSLQGGVGVLAAGDEQQGGLLGGVGVLPAGGEQQGGLLGGAGDGNMAVQGGASPVGVGDGNMAVQGGASPVMAAPALDAGGGANGVEGTSIPVLSSPPSSPIPNAALPSPLLTPPSPHTSVSNSPSQPNTVLSQFLNQVSEEIEVEEINNNDSNILSNNNTQAGPGSTQVEEVEQVAVLPGATGLQVGVDLNNVDSVSQQVPTQPSQASQELPLPPLHELPSLEDIHRTHIKTITWVPKAARAEFTRVIVWLC